MSGDNHGEIAELIELANNRDEKLNKVIHACQDMVARRSRKDPIYRTVRMVAIPETGNLVYVLTEMQGILSWCMTTDEWMALPKKWLRLIANPDTHKDALTRWEAIRAKQEEKRRAKEDKKMRAEKEKLADKEYEEFITLTNKYGDEYRKHPELFK